MKPLPFEFEGVKTTQKSGRQRGSNKKTERAKLISRIVAYSDTNNPRCAKTVLRLIEDTRSFILKIDLEKRKVMGNKNHKKISSKKKNRR
jgi:hypothetical protein